MTAPRVHMTGSEWFTTAAGGLNRYFTDLYDALAARSDIDVTGASFGRPPAGGHSWGGPDASTLTRVWRSRRRDLTVADGTVIDRHFCLYGASGRLRHRRHPMVFHFHGPWSAEAAMAGHGGANARAKLAVERAQYRQVDRFVVLSRHFQDLLCERYDVPAGAIEIIPPGVDLDRFTFHGEPSDGPPTVLCVRRLVPRMGIDVLIEAWQEVTAQVPEARLVVVGTGPSEAALREQVARTGLQRCVDFAGRVNDERLDALYDAATLTAVPSVALEGFGLAAIESLATGRAPVVTDCGGLPETVERFDPSLIVPAGDTGALAERLVAALRGRRPTAAQCRAHAEQFSWSAAADRHVQLYTAVTADRRAA